MATAAQTTAPTNAELLRLLEAVHAELAEIRVGQRELGEAVARLATPAG
jgi:hypothetical protein